VNEAKLDDLPRNPKSLDEVIEVLLKTLSPKTLAMVAATTEEELINFHFSLGMDIRNRLGSWLADPELMASFGFTTHEDDMSDIVIRALWAKLQARH
jgi:hypothetical protein